MRRHRPLPPRSHFFRRTARAALVAAGIVLGSLLLGSVGYRLTEGMPWVDALLNASMILAGMGPVGDLRTTSGKLFASAYALFSGVAFLTTIAVLLAPAAHRFLHRFHLEVEDEEPQGGRAGR